MGEPGQVKQLTLTQQIALQKVQEELALARRNFNRAQDRYHRVLGECGMEIGVNYDVSPDGVVTRAAEQPTLEKVD